jgi:hypothetical protein
MWVHIRQFMPQPLPRGLRDGMRVEVIRAEHDKCIVRDVNGRDWLVDSVLLDPGSMVWIDGHWEAESERKVG